MTKWEYKAIGTKTSAEYGTIHWLRNLGLEGWELVGIWADSYDEIAETEETVFYFKRPLFVEA